MRYNKIANSDLSVSEIGIGCMSLSRHATSSFAVIQEAFNLGINLFDTADLYDRGENELLVGKAVRPFRKDIILATKVGNQWFPDQEGWSWNASKAYILQAVDHSLRRLQTDYIDLYQLHGGTNVDNIEDVLDAFTQLKQQGKIRYFGISSIRPNVFTKYVEHHDLQTNMMQYSLLDTCPEEYSDVFSKHQKSILARGVLAQGLLLGNKAMRRYLQHSEETVQQIVHQVSSAGEYNGVSNQAIALKYVLQQPMIASVMVGIRDRQQMEALQLSYKELHKIPNATIADLFMNIPKVRYQDHR